MREDLNVETAPILPAMPPGARPLQNLVLPLQIFRERWDSLRRTDVPDGHTVEFLAAVSVFRNGCVVDDLERQSLGIVHPGWLGIRVKKQAIERFTNLQCLLNLFALLHLCPEFLVQGAEPSRTLLDGNIHILVKTPDALNL